MNGSKSGAWNLDCPSRTKDQKDLVKTGSFFISQTMDLARKQGNGATEEWGEWGGIGKLITQSISANFHW